MLTMSTSFPLPRRFGGLGRGANKHGMVVSARILAWYEEVININQSCVNMLFYVIYFR